MEKFCLDSAGAEYRAARAALLEKEVALKDRCGEVAALRRALPRGGEASAYVCGEQARFAGRGFALGGRGRGCGRSRPARGAGRSGGPVRGRRRISGPRRGDRPAPPIARGNRAPANRLPPLREGRRPGAARERSGAPGRQCK